MKTLLLLGCLALMPPCLAGQQVQLSQAGNETRGFWRRQDAAGLVQKSPQLVIQLPGADPSAPVTRPQAEELLRDYFHQAEEVETVLSDARDVGGGWGFVELKRRYRIRGTQEIREQLLLLSYRANGTGWVLMELRAGQ
ncbi:MAG: hypothetical protein ABI679_13620 [Gemmatimonadota bacterium]